MALSPSETAYELAHLQDDARSSIIITISFCFVIASVAVILRVISRRLRRLRLLADDYMAMIALIFAAGLAANVAVDIYGGLGKHVVLAKHPVLFAKSFLAGEVLYVTTVVPIKLSLIFLYHRIFPSRSFHVMLWITGILVVIMGVMGDFLAIFNCVPIEANWNPAIPARCINFRAAIIFHGTQNVLLDFLILILPMPLVWRLQMPTAKKVQVSGIFVLGGFASIASIVRLKYLSQVSSVDATWYNVAPTIWSMIEVYMGITACCLPTFGPIISYVLYGRVAAQGGVRRQRFLSDEGMAGRDDKTKISVSTTSWPETEPSTTRSLTKTVSHFSSYGSTPEHRRSTRSPLSRIMRSSQTSRKESSSTSKTAASVHRLPLAPKPIFAGTQYWKPLPPPPFARVPRARTASAVEMTAVPYHYNRGVDDAEARLYESIQTVVERERQRRRSK